MLKNPPVAGTSVETSGAICTGVCSLHARFNDDAAIAHVVHETAKFFKRADTPLQDKNTFLRGMYEAHAHLKTCVSSFVLFALFDIQVRYR